ncbi:MAG: NnrU family protein [Kiloniellaceae bacterium]
MTGSIDALFAATALFVGGHFLLSSRPLRRPLVGMLGPRGFLPVYSAVVAVAFVWMVTAYGSAPYVEVWTPAPAARWIPVAVMPVAIFLVVAGLTTPNPTMVGAERAVDIGGPKNPATGIISITRHPFLWGTTLWALSHLAVNGDLASLIFMGGILALSLGGMAHIDLRREDALGAAWGPIKLTTSVLPFGAVLSGRNRIDWKGIGWQRPAAALVLYAALLHAHAWLFGVSALPG